MRIAIDLDDRTIRTWAGQVVATLTAKRRDRFPVEVRFIRGGVVQELATGATGAMGVKMAGAYAGGFLASATSWSKSGSSLNAVYTFDLALNTTEVETAFESDPASVSALLEVEWVQGTIRESSLSTELTIHNDVIRGDEGIPSAATPYYPLPSEIELIARKGQNSGYAGLDGFGKVPLAQLPHTSASFYDTPNRFTADHTGWKVGDIIRQLGDSSPASLQIEVTSPAPGGAQEVVEITASDVPEGAMAGFQLYSNFGSSSWMDQSGPLSAADYATAIKNFLDGDCSWLGSAAINGAVVTFTFNSFGSASPAVTGDYAGLSVLTPGVYQMPFSFAGAFYDQSGNYYSAYAGVYGPMPAEGFAQEIANALTNNIPFLNVAVNGTVVSATYNFPDKLPSQPYFYDPSGNGQLWQASFTDGVAGVPPGTFLVSDISAQGNAEGYKGIGDTVDFLSGYGAPSSSVGSLGNGYVDLNNGNFYHRSDSGWFFVLNIKGPQGQQGAQGPQGQDGQEGPVGPQGVQGSAGTSSGDLSRYATYTMFRLPDQSLTLPYPWAGASGYDGNNYWVVYSSSSFITKIDLKTFSVTASYAIPAGSYQSLTFTPDHVWILLTQSGSKYLCKVKKSDGSVAGTYALNDAGAMSVCFAGEFIWVASQTTTNLLKINPSTGAIAATYTLPGKTWSNRFSFDGAYLYIPCSYLTPLGIFKVSSSTGNAVATFSMPSNFNLGSNMFDGTYLWQTGGVGSNNCVYKVNPGDGTVLGSVDPGFSICNDVWVNASEIYLNKNDNTTVRKYRKSTLQQIASFSSTIGPMHSDGSFLYGIESSSGKLLKVDMFSGI